MAGVAVVFASGPLRAALDDLMPDHARQWKAWARCERLLTRPADLYGAARIAR